MKTGAGRTFRNGGNLNPRRTDDLEYLSVGDVQIVQIGDLAWLKARQKPKRQAGQIPADVLNTRGLINLEEEISIRGRIFASPYRFPIEWSLTWRDLLHASPKTLVLQKAGLIVFAARTKTRGVSERRPWGARSFSCNAAKNSWAETVFDLFARGRGPPDRDLRIGQPLENNDCHFSNARNFDWALANDTFRFI